MPQYLTDIDYLPKPGIRPCFKGFMVGLSFFKNCQSGPNHFCLENNNPTGSVFSVYSNGYLTVNLGYMDKICTREKIDDFRIQLAAIPSFFEIETTDKYFFTLTVNSAFSQSEYLEQFKVKVLQLKSSLSSSL